MHVCNSHQVSSYGLLLLGVFACSTSVIFIRKSQMDAVLLSSARLLLAAVFMAPLFLREWRKWPERNWRAVFGWSIWPALLLGVHFITWIVGARLTLAANASIIVNMLPAVSPVLLYLVARETLTRPEWLGTGLAMAGIVLLAVQDYHVSQEYFWGDTICFGSMLFYGVYLMLARKNRGIGSIWLYVVPLYFLSGLFCLLIYGCGLQIPAGGAEPPSALREWLCVLGLAVIPTILGHSIMNWAFRHLRGQVVALCNLGQFIFAGILAYFLLGDIPHSAFYWTTFLLIAGATIAILGKSPSGNSRPGR